MSFSARAAGSWDASPQSQARLRAAVAGVSALVFFIHDANDFSSAPGTVLAADMKRFEKPHRLRIYPPVGR
ncbi:MAG: hypothetical protein DMG08_18740 [Acidobacteria bacterium]|nr:MAG: hypothetical protein DMG08_18740 [Acidobacteriota bacterium]